MEQTPKGIYTHEFHAEAVKLVGTTDLSVMRAAKRLLIPKSSLDDWARAAWEGKLAAKLVRGSECRAHWSLNWCGRTRSLLM